MYLSRLVKSVRIQKKRQSTKIIHETLILYWMQPTHNGARDLTSWPQSGRDVVLDGTIWGQGSWTRSQGNGLRYVPSSFEISHWHGMKVEVKQTKRTFFVNKGPIFETSNILTGWSLLPCGSSNWPKVVAMARRWNVALSHGMWTVCHHSLISWTQ